MIKTITFFLALSLFLALILSSAATNLYAQEDYLDKYDVDLFEPADESTAENYRNMIKGEAPKEDAFVALQRLAEEPIRKKDWATAIAIFEEFRPLFPNMDSRFEKIIGILSADSENISPTDLGNGVNTNAGEYHPTPTADGKLLYFTGYERGEDHGFEDVFVSSNKSGQWANATKLKEPINTPLSEAVMSISADGNQIILFGNYKGSFGNGDVFYSQKTYLGWGRVKHFPYPINTSYFDCDAQLTPDGQAIIFASDRPGGMGEYHPKGEEFHGDITGNLDIWVCLKTGSGWSEPINLGPTINTQYTDRMPFLHPDGKTLYFCSDGHYGLGRSDVYMSRRLSEDTWTEWSEPVNLGKEINTPGKEFSFKVSTLGNVGYLATGVRPEVYDIFSFPLPKNARPSAVATINGLVVDRGGNPLGAHITIKEIISGKPAEHDSDPEDGTFFFALEIGKNYIYEVTKDNYETVTREINLLNEDPSVNFSRNDTIVMKSKVTGDFIDIDNILFASGSAEVDSRSYPELNRLAQILVDNPNLRLEISAHTDDVGSESYNQGLSERRAKSIVDYLVKKGVAANRLEWKGYGESRPIAPNDTEEGKTLNRRVETRILK